MSAHKSSQKKKKRKGKKSHCPLHIISPQQRGCNTVYQIAMAPVERWAQNIVFWRTASLPLASASFFLSIFWEWRELSACLLVFVFPAHSIESHNSLRIWMLDYWLNAASKQVIKLCQLVFAWYLYFVILTRLLTTPNLDSNLISEVSINYV